MESLYIEELKSAINLLMTNLESLPVSKGSMDSKYGLQKLKRYNHRLHNHNNPYNVKHLLMNYVTSFRSQGSLAKLEGDSADSDTTLTKMDVVLTFQLEVRLWCKSNWLFRLITCFTIGFFKFSYLSLFVRQAS